jgi:hypothetical protein
MYKGLQKGTLPGISGQHFKGLDRGIYKGLQHNTATIQKETMAWLQAIDKSGYPRPSWRYVVDMDWFIINLKQAGIWPLLDRLWVFATEHRGHARIPINIPTATPITEINSPMFTRGKGYTGDGISAYLNLNYNPHSQGVNYTLNNNSFGYYLISQISFTNQYGMGVGDGTNLAAINAPFFNSSTYYSFSYNNDPLNDQSVGTSSPQKSLFSSVRTISTQMHIYNRGVDITSSLTQSSASIPNFVMYGLGANNAGSIGAPTSALIGMSYTGSGNINQVTFYNIIQSFAIKIGFNV